MKILFTLFKYNPFGGLERDMMRMAKCAADRGHEVVILTHRWDGELPAEPGIRVETVGLKRLTNPGRAAELGEHFKAMVRHGDYDVSVAFNRIGGGDFYFAADNCMAVEQPKKHHWLYLKLRRRYRIYFGMEREVFAPEAATRIFYIAPRQKSDYQRIYGTPEARFLYLPPGINADCRRGPDAEGKRAAMRQALNLADDEFMLLLVGSYLKLKGADRAIRALAALEPELQLRTRLFLVGRTHLDELGKLAQKLGVTDRVVFLGSRSDIPELLAAADLMVHPARNEATGTVLVEALAAALPVVCSGACGFHNFVAEAGSEVTPEPFEQHDLNAAVVKMLRELPAYREKALSYGAAADFYSRADRAVDCLEAFAQTADS